MSEKDKHHVHFGDGIDSFGKDNEIVIKGPDHGKLTAHLGFLQLGHRYQVSLTLSRDLFEVDEGSQMQELRFQNDPNVNCKLVDIDSGNEGIVLKIELFAHKEKLLKEEIPLDYNGKASVTELTLMARVLGRGKGTPLLKNGIKCIGAELDYESDASDWQGFA